MFIRKIVSGGQAGADRAGLDAAIAAGVPHGGWCPAGRWAEDGTIPAGYDLQETAARNPIVRTRRNVAESDATLIFAFGPPAGGSLATVSVARRIGRPYLVIDLDAADDAGIVRRITAWLESLTSAGEAGLVLNIAGTRGSRAPGIYERVRTILDWVLRNG
jgi:hypothetical protein